MKVVKIRSRNGTELVVIVEGFVEATSTRGEVTRRLGGTSEDVDACSDIARSRAAAAEAGGDAVGDGVHLTKRQELGVSGVYESVGSAGVGQRLALPDVDVRMER